MLTFSNQNLPKIIKDAESGNLHAIRLAKNLWLSYKHPKFEQIINYNYKVAMPKGFGSSIYKYMTIYDILKCDAYWVRNHYADEIQSFMNLVESPALCSEIQAICLDIGLPLEYDIVTIINNILDSGCDLRDAVYYSFNKVGVKTLYMESGEN